MPLDGFSASDVTTKSAKLGMVGGLPSSTKEGVVIFDGHSAKGMLQAMEIANIKSAAYITTVSKRGRPGAPGPGAAFVASMANSTVHYMAACDHNDPKAVECLMNWAPPAAPVQVPIMMEVEDSGVGSMLDKVKREMASMSPAQLSGALHIMEEANRAIVANQREIKRRLQHKDFADQKARLQEQLLETNEQETAVLEVIADITVKVNASSLQE